MNKHRYFWGWVLLFLFIVSVGRVAAAPQTRTPCTNGLAGIYPCAGVDLLAHLPFTAIGAEDGSIQGNDHWGWTDPQTGHNYVIFGLSNGVSFIDITDPENPLYLGKLPSHGGSSLYRDMKVYQDIVYVVADEIPNHGLQMFDLTELRQVTNPPVTFSETAHYTGIGAAHMIWINQATGYMYVTLRSTDGSCNAGIQMLDLQNPLSPTLAGCLDENEAPLSHSECLIYDGPDADYLNHEICFLASDDNVSIADVTQKNDPSIISRFTYPGIMRAHQGAATGDLHYWLISDMDDEMHHGHNTRTHIVDIADLDNPVVLGYFEGNTPAMDHSLFVKGNYAYEANFRAGMQVFDISHLPDNHFIPVAYFDVDPTSNSPTMNGAWSAYPWWNDNIVTISDTDSGLFITQITFTPTDVTLLAWGGAAASTWPLSFWFFVSLGGSCLWLVLRRRIHPRTKDARTP